MRPDDRCVGVEPAASQQLMRGNPSGDEAEQWTYALSVIAHMVSLFRRDV